MRQCFQFQDQSVLDHGLSVHEWFLDLYAHVTTGVPLKRQWRLPAWFKTEYFGLFQKHLPSLEMLRNYQIYHDCGKPYCQTFDEAGRAHFPDHAEHSYVIWMSHGGDHETGLLIRQDMDLHCLKAEDLPEFAQRPQAIALLLTALAEIHSNAQMFGGLGSDSFKIKCKHLERRGKRLLHLIQGFEK